jgi:hypothetical protein
VSVANVYERQMLDLINAERTAMGLEPLQLELRLNAASESHSAWMNATGVFSHTGSGGSRATERMSDTGFDFSGQWSSGENLAWQSLRGAVGIADDVVDLHVALMNSPGHRANILSPNYEYVGIGIVEGVFNGLGGVMITQNFARTTAEVQLDPGPAAVLPDAAPVEVGAAASRGPGPVESAPPPPPAGEINALEYIASHDDLMAAFGTNAAAGLAHFQNSGQAEGRGITFDGLDYIASHDDLIAVFGANADAGAIHFINHGQREGRATTFDALEYIASHDDLIVTLGANADAGATHFINEGIQQGRLRDDFDAQQYLDNYADLTEAFGSDLEAATVHFIETGFFEGSTDDFLFW